LCASSTPIGSIAFCVSQATWCITSCGTSSEHLESVNVTTGRPDKRITLTGFKVCPTCGGHPAIDL
jgi:hypothetical protein